MLPANLKKYFWEVDTNKLNPKKRPEYVISRIVEYGRPDAIKWAWSYFSKKEWQRALELRGVSRKSRNFWLPLLYNKR